MNCRRFFQENELSGDRFPLVSGGWQVAPLVFILFALAMTGADVTHAELMDGMLPQLVTPSPFNVLSEIEHGEGVELRLDAGSYEEIKGAPHLQIMGFALDSERTVDLELTRFSIVGPDAQFIVVTEQGEMLLRPPDVVTLSGSVIGHPESEVYLGLSPHGCNGYLTLENERYILAPKPGWNREGKQLDCAIYRRDSIHWVSQGPWCRTTHSPQAPPPVRGEPESEREFRERPDTYLVCDVAVDTDHEFCDVLFDGDVWAATAYSLELWAAASTIYERELSVKLQLCFLRIWTGSDPWYLHGVEDFVLEELRSHWLAYLDDVDRTVVHRQCGWATRGGLAWEDGLCSDQAGYAISCLEGSFHYPLEPDNDSWDVGVIIHELGHNFGSPHTHCYDPPIDHCWNCEGCDDTLCVFPDCETCPYCDDRCYHGPIECTYGSIMSYCDSCSPDSLENKSYSFHARVIDEEIRPHMDAVTCLGEGRDPVYVDWRNTGPEDGSEQFPFREVRDAVRVVLGGGTIHIADGGYADSLIIWHPMTLRHNGVPGVPVVIIGQ